MITSRMMVEAFSSSELLVSTQNLVESCAGLEAELLLHLGEIEHRKLFLDCGHSSLFVFCVKTYGFSEDIACNRIAVARVARQFPAILDAVRSGQVHLSGLRLLIPHLTDENHRDLLARAADKSKREIEELVACLAPQPPVPTVIRKLPERSEMPLESQQPLALTAASPSTRPVSVERPAPSNSAAPPQHRPVIAPLSEATFKIQFTASRAFRDKLRQAQDLLRHRLARRRSSLDPGERTRSAHRTGEERALRDGSQGATDSHRASRRSGEPPHSGRDQARSIRTRRGALHVCRPDWSQMWRDRLPPIRPHRWVCAGSGPSGGSNPAAVPRT